METFWDCQMDYDLQDLGCLGKLFTWCNHREHPATVWKRLDRVCGDRWWMDGFSKASVSYLLVACSNHTSVLLRLEAVREEASQRRRPGFWFEATWLRSEECEAAVEQG
ncbi:UNVERIFIED_CONTAM: hypothetical protein Slati_1490900 [Sesamum latifolium]|uniref:Uncharacterized protein n=1 Tax=Sesamum latifolium TaxID=2727402 RepID=A0AAW2X778_9LAMI